MEQETFKQWYREMTQGGLTNLQCLLEAQWEARWAAEARCEAQKTVLINVQANLNRDTQAGIAAAKRQLDLGFHGSKPAIETLDLTFTTPVNHTLCEKLNEVIAAVNGLAERMEGNDVD